MKHLSESILSKKTGMYKNTILPHKSNVLEWLKKNNFRKCNPHDYVGKKEHREILSKEKNDIYYCGKNIGPFTNWIAIHTKDIYELVIWFDENDDVDEIELRHYPIGIDHFTFDDAVKTLLEA